ncbi:hypothetical protein TWF694_000204 [Orbilia ellipsospora]|uniref:Mid2 domain-containing protein n=1 Tax=Orbilia ellipsospora TaxID=2528407 RepID=A0AAV9XMY9_9PEZI
MQRIPIISILFLLIHLVSAQSTRPCYFPSGDPATDYVACDDSTTGHSACCRNSNQTACFATGLCYLQNGFIERGACTDQSWQSDNCPGPCRDFGSSGQDLLACDDSTGSFCCGTGSNPSCCSNSSTYFTFNIGDIAFINGAAVARTRTSSTPRPSGTRGNGNGNGNGNSTASSMPEVVDKTSSGVIVGLAVGIAIPSIVAIGFATLYFRERKRAGKYKKSANAERIFAENTQYNGYTSNDHGESEGFMRDAYAPGGNGIGAAVIPPKYVPPERRAPAPQVQHQHQPHQQQPSTYQEVEEAPAQTTPVGELPAGLEGLSELGGADRRYS